jgi:hypothetical protein
MNYNTLKITQGSGKMEKLKSINTNTLTNEFCKKQSKNKNIICSSCYSINNLKTFRKSCVPSRQHNSDLLDKKIIHKELLPTILDIYFRFNSDGELINDIHLINLLNICEKNKHTTFALWTKRKDIVYQVERKRKLPKNLILVFSNSQIDKPLKTIPRLFHKTFNSVSDSFDKSTVNCSGKCVECLKCYVKDNNINQIVEVMK